MDRAALVNLSEKSHPCCLARLRHGFGSSTAFARTMHIDRPIRVLIVDDDSVDRRLCKHCLQQSTVWEFEFAETDSAAAGIELANTWRPDCALLDFNLPDLNGIEVLSRLGRDP